MSDADSGNSRGQRFAWLVVAAFLALFLLLMLMIAHAPGVLAASVAGGFTWGHLLVLVLHVVPVAAAWLYIYIGPAPRV